MVLPRFKRTTLITLFCAAFLTGLWLGHSWWQVEAGLVAVALAACLLAHKTRLLALAVVIAALNLGIWRGYQSNFTYAAIHSLLYHKVELAGRVEDDPVVTDSGRVKFSLGRLRYGQQKLPGSVRVTSHYVKLDRGNTVRVTGRLYPTVGSRQAQFGFAAVQRLGDDAGPLEDLRRRFFAGMRNALPEPLASLALGLLVGTRGLLPKAVQDQLSSVGLSHMVAVSGYNLTILSMAAYEPLARWSRRLATMATLGLVGMFCLVTGFSASIVRAAVVAGLSLLCAYYGRTVKPLVLVGLAAAGTAAVRPEYLWADAGWQLSFLAFIGILVLAPAVEHRFVRRPNVLKSLVIQSLAAQIMTLPLILAMFGRLAAAGILANVLIMPLVPAAMLTSFVAGLAGMVAPTAAGWIAWPALLWLHLMLVLVGWLSAVLPASDQALSKGLMWAWYGLTVVWLWLLARSRRPVSLSAE